VGVHECLWDRFEYQYQYQYRSAARNRLLCAFQRGLLETFDIELHDADFGI
jgi:hypothetical protein